MLRPAAAPALTDRDPVVLADVDNLTGDAVFDGTLRAALAVAIGQSPYLNVVPEARVRETLRLMGRAADARVTLDVGREVCQREQATAVLSGTIAELGGAYAVTLEALACATGDSLAVEQERAADKAAVLDALGAAASRLRAKLGESLASVRAMDAPLARATTSSLDALKAYSLAEASRVSGVDDNDAIALYRRALELDPDFALAHARLGTVLSNRDAADASIQHQRRAYELRDRVSEDQRLYITAHYYGNVTDEVPKYLEALRVWHGTYPNDFSAPNNLAVIHLQLGDYPAARDAAREALRLAPRHVLPRLNLGWALYFNGELAEASAAVQDAVAAGLASDFTREVPAWSAYFRGDAAEVERQLAEQGELGRRGVRTLWRFKPWHLLRQGKGAEAVRLWTAIGDRDRQAGRQEAEILALVKLARVQAMLGHDEPARRRRARRPHPGRRGAAAARARPRAGRGRRRRGRARLDRADARGGARQHVRQPAGDSQVLASLALREHQPERAIEALRPVGSLDFSYTASALYLRTRALREAGALPRCDGRGRTGAGAPVAARAAGHRSRAGAGVRAGGGGRGRGRDGASGVPGPAGAVDQADADFPLLLQARAELARLGS